ncbi:[protein-PII] uridylyltransferase [Desulfolithobacter sp.]
MVGARLRRGRKVSGQQKNLRAQREALEELWRQGLSGHELLHRHTALVDRFIIDQFQASEAVARARGNIALIALGGYGRRELYPFSDIDLLLLHDWKAGRYMQDVAESILYPLWDANFDVGHSVRSVKGAVNFAREDFIFQVSLLDARFLAGSEKLFDKLWKRYRAKLLDGRRNRFVQTMDQFREQRREKYGSHAYLLEPHIKEGKGGMRDIQAMLWVAKAVFGLADLRAIEESGMLQTDECRLFQESWDMLARIRNRLHYVSRRKNDQLIFEYQEEIATAFGYHDKDGLLGVEQFMRQVYGHLQTIAVTTDYFFEHVHEVLGITGTGREEKSLEKAIVLRSGTIRLVRADELAQRPYLLMRLFLQAGRTGAPLHHRTRQLVSGNLGLVDDRFRSSRRVAGIFLELLMGTDPMPVLETMLETGLLTAYIPEFARVESLAQHDLYHIYTVDRHQLQTVAELARLKQEDSDLFLSLASPHLVYLAALLHDIGKGQGADHSMLGAEMVEDIGCRLGLPAEERACLSFLVRYHLYLPENAMRRDLEDQAFIEQAAGLIGDVDRLTMLYLLTIADSRATGPSAWSSWKATLLADMFLKVKTCLEAGCGEGDELDGGSEEQGVNWLREQVHSLLEPGEELRMDVARLPADYLTSFTPEMVVRHLRLHRDQATMLQQKVLIFPEARPGSWSLLIMSKDRPGLLAKLCGVLSLHNLSVLAAQIFTWPDKTVVDVLDVVPMAQSDFEEQDWEALERDVNLAVNHRLDVTYQLHRRLHGVVGMRPRRKVQQLVQEVVVDNETSRRFTVIEVYGGDRPGTLYRLAQTLADFGLDIHRARIATEVEQLIDIFYVTLRSGDKLTDEEMVDKVRGTLLHIIAEDEENA